MADSIQFRRGLRSTVKPLPVGMPGFVEDEERLVIGKGDGTNAELPNKADMDNVNSQMADIVNIKIFSSIQKAINYACLNKKELFIPAGTYDINNSLIINNPIKIKTAGRNTILNNKTNDYAIKIYPNEASEVSYEGYLGGIEIEPMLILGEKRSHIAHGIYAEQLEQFNIEVLTEELKGYGLNANRCREGNFYGHTRFCGDYTNSIPSILIQSGDRINTLPTTDRTNAINIEKLFVIFSFGDCIVINDSNIVKINNMMLHGFVGLNDANFGEKFKTIITANFGIDAYPSESDPFWNSFNLLVANNSDMYANNLYTQNSGGTQIQLNNSILFCNNIRGEGFMQWDSPNNNLIFNLINNSYAFIIGGQITDCYTLHSVDDTSKIFTIGVKVDSQSVPNAVTNNQLNIDFVLNFKNKLITNILRVQSIQPTSATQRFDLDFSVLSVADALGFILSDENGFKKWSLMLTGNGTSRRALAYNDPNFRFNIGQFNEPTSSIEGDIFWNKTLKKLGIHSGSEYNYVPRIVSVPSTSSSEGSKNDIAIDSNYIYVCVALNTWKRIALTTW